GSREPDFPSHFAPDRAPLFVYTAKLVRMPRPLGLLPSRMRPWKPYPAGAGGATRSVVGSMTLIGSSPRNLGRPSPVRDRRAAPRRPDHPAFIRREQCSPGTASARLLLFAPWRRPWSRTVCRLLCSRPSRRCARPRTWRRAAHQGGGLLAHLVGAAEQEVADQLDLAGAVPLEAGEHPPAQGADQRGDLLLH